MNHDFATFKSQLDEAMNSSYHIDLENLRSWTSMQALIAVSAIDEHYDVLITHDELAAVSTLKELFALVQQKAS